MFCYDSPEYVKDMGTPERYYSVCKDCKEGKISAKNLKNKQKAIFLDRDGTINKYVGFLRNIDDFELIDVTNSNEGEGLLFYGNTIIPFKDKFDTSLKLYSLMTTKPNEMGKYKEKKEA